ncbi:aspartate oxidase [Bradyrhizobium sp. JR3.5]
MRTDISDLNGRPVIIGGGAAGLMTALQLAPEPVVLLSKSPLGAEASSMWAQGGLAAPVGADDTPALHLADTLAAGAGLCDAAAASRIVHAAPAAVEHLAELGVAFDRRADGSWRLGLEAAHGRNRIVHATGDGTGREIMRALIATVRQTPSITLLEGVEARRLLVKDNAVRGVLAASDRGALTIATNRVVIATGGIGGLFSDSTNPGGCFGQGLALAAHAGAKLSDLEFVQFHPTGLRWAVTADATVDRGDPRRWRDPDRRDRPTLHGRSARRRARATRHRRARRLAPSRRRTPHLPRCAQASGRGLRAALSRDQRVLQDGGHRSRQ